MNIKLYYMPNTRAFRVRWLLEELGIHYQLQYIDLFKGETHSKAFRAIHPLGHLPAIEIDGKAMFESGAICAWLADQFPQAKLAPAFDSADRREYEQWMYFVPGEVEPPLFYHQLHNRVLPGDIQVKEILPWLRERYTRTLRALHNQLQNKQYLLGDNFSTADIMLGSTISWLPELLEPFPALENYIKCLSTRKAYINATRDEVAQS
ncbi:MAG: glutathione S-transferase family protein [Gammaproteobacteria bacterium]|nr:glutathione S-transferase family protein [Gammaproteobacteria bacterium]